MWIGKLFGDPDDYLCFQACEVGQDLAKVIVIGYFKLVLYQYEAVVLGVPCQDVSRKC
ncbi:protein of unknown function [Cyanobium sp. NIES-981]|nr:protein of unknown function [Cyanobium sp. NIES-981]